MQYHDLIFQYKIPYNVLDKGVSKVWQEMFFWAVYHNKIELTRQILKHYPDQDHIEYECKWAYSYIFGLGYDIKPKMRMLKLLENYTMPDKDNIESYISHVCKRNDIQLAEYLMKNHAIPDMKNMFLHKSCIHSDTDFIEHILKYKPDLKYERKLTLNSDYIMHYDMIEEAYRSGRPEVLKLLVSYAGNLSLKQYTDALKTSVRYSNNAMLQYLIEAPENEFLFAQMNFSNDLQQYAAYDFLPVQKYEEKNLSEVLCCLVYLKSKNIYEKTATIRLMTEIIAQEKLDLLVQCWQELELENLRTGDLEILFNAAIEVKDTHVFTTLYHVCSEDQKQRISVLNIFLNSDHAKNGTGADIFDLCNIKDMKQIENMNLPPAIKVGIKKIFMETVLENRSESVAKKLKI